MPVAVAAELVSQTQVRPSHLAAQDLVILLLMETSAEKEVLAVQWVSLRDHAVRQYGKIDLQSEEAGQAQAVAAPVADGALLSALVMPVP